MVAMLCCLSAADRVVWLRLHRYGLSFCNVACFGVVSLKRGIYCGGLCERAVGVLHAAHRTAGQLSVPRGTLCMWPSTTSSSAPISTRRGRFPVWTCSCGVRVAVWLHCFFEGIAGTLSAEDTLC